MPAPNGDLVSSVSDLAIPFPNGGELAQEDLSEGLRSQFADATVIGLGEASHGTQEFFDLRSPLIRLVVEEFGVRAIGFEAPFDPLHRVDDLVAAGEGDIRPLVTEIDIYRPIKSETIVDLFEWLQSYTHVVSLAALIVGLVALGAGIPSVVRPQAVLDVSCQLSPFCRSPRQLSYAGRTYHRVLGAGLALVGLLLIASAVVGTFN